MRVVDRWLAKPRNKPSYLLASRSHPAPIGKAIATRLAQEGATVAVNYGKDATSAEALVVDLNDQGFKTRAFQADVSKPAE